MNWRRRLPAFWRLLRAWLLERQIVKTYTVYWNLYGGARAILLSPYVYAALAITGILWPIWMKVGISTDDWTGTAIDIIPSLLGFSMGGMAIMLAFSNQTIFPRITQSGNKRSYFLKVVANFFHFILVQTIALLLALSTHAYQSVGLSFIAFFFVMYGTLVALATAGQLLWTAQIFNATASPNLPKDPADEG